MFQAALELVSVSALVAAAGHQVSVRFCRSALASAIVMAMELALGLLLVAQALAAQSGSVPV